MKKLSKILMLLGMTSLVAFTGCKKDEDTPVADADKIKATFTVYQVVGTTATKIESGAQVRLNDSLLFIVNFTGTDNNKLKHYTITSSNEVSPVKDADLTGLTGSVTFGGYVSEKDTGKTIIITATVKGEKETITPTFTYIVTVDAPKYSLDADGPTLGNQNGTVTEKRFWSAKRKMLYNLSDLVSAPTTQTDVDFAYCSRTTGNLLISPSSQDATDIYSSQWGNATEKITNWLPENRRTTLMIKVNDDAIKAAFNDPNSDLETLIAQARAKAEPNNPSVAVLDGDLYLFKTQRGYYGLFKVIQPSGGVSGSPPSADPGNVNLSIQYQREN